MNRNNDILESDFSLYFLTDILSKSTIEKIMTHQQLSLYDFVFDTDKLHKKMSNKQAMIKKIKDYLSGFSLETLQKKHINHLAAVGLSIQNIKLLHDAHIQYEELAEMTYALFVSRVQLDVRENIYERIIAAYEQLEEKMPITSGILTVSANSNDDNAKVQKLKFFLSNFEDGTYFTTEQLLQNFTVEDLKKFLNLHLLIKDGLCYRKKYNDLNFYLDKISEVHSGAYIDILLSRIKGEKSRQQLANEQNVSRQAIANREKALLKKIPFTEEEARYLGYFRDLKLSKVLFCELFSECNQTYNFLSLRHNQGEKNPLLCLDDYYFTNEQKLTIVRHNKGYINHRNEITPITRLAVFEDVLFYNARSIAISDEEIFEDFNEYILRNNLKLNLAKKPSELRGLHERCTRILQGRSHTYRYYDVNKLTDQDLMQLRGFLDLPTGLYNMNKIFENHESFFKEIDVQNGYELHNLYKTFVPVENVDFRRMPEFAVGHIEKEDFLIHLFLEQAPIHIDEFLDYVHDTYGLKKTSLKSFIQMNLYEYISEDIIRVEYEDLSKTELDDLRALLTEDIHTIDEIIEQGNTKYERFSEKFINNMVLNKIGYSIRGSFILTSRYRSADRYLTELVLSKDFYTNERSAVERTQTFGKVIYDLEKERKIFKIEPYTYVTLTRLEEAGISENMILDFMVQIRTASEEYKFFTIDMLRMRGFNHPLFGYGFEKLFYDRIIWTHPDFKTITLADGYIFMSRFSKDVSLRGFLTHIIGHYKAIDAYDLLDNLKSTYNLTFDLSKVITILQPTDIYYSSELSKFYSNKDVFYNEIYYN